MVIVPPMPQGYPRGSPQQYNPQQMMAAGGVPMTNQPSNSYMGGPMPQQQQQSYSPMPPHAQPHFPQMQQGGYTGSPRPNHMMQHTVSHQGFQPHMHMGQQQPHFAGQGGYGGAQGGMPSPYHMQQRQMSSGGMSMGGYPQMTPRQSQAQVAGVMQGSPGMPGGGGMHGDEGK